MGLFEGGVILRLVGVMEVEWNVIVCIIVFDELDDGMWEKLLVLFKVKWVVSFRWFKYEIFVMIEVKWKYEFDI